MEVVRVAVFESDLYEGSVRVLDLIAVAGSMRRIRSSIEA